MLKVGSLFANKGEKKQGLVEVYETGTAMPVTLINGINDGKTILITAGIHGVEYPCIQTAIELAQEINPKDVNGKIIIIHPVNTQSFKKKTSAVVPEDGKNINRIFPGDKNGTLAEQIGHFITYECQSKADFYVDIHGGDLHELTTPFVYYPGIADEEIISASREIASILDVKYMVKSVAKTGAYNSAAIRGLPSILIERGGRGLWNNQEVKEYKKDILTILNHFDIIKDIKITKVNTEMITDITKAIYLEADVDGCWYPRVSAGQRVEEGDILGEIKDFFGNILMTYYAEISGVVLYMTVSLSVESDEPLIAYGEC